MLNLFVRLVHILLDDDDDDDEYVGARHAVPLHAPALS